MDIYKEVSDLESDLRSCGEGLRAEQMANAVACGSTGTEILMAVRWLLVKFMEQPELEKLRPSMSRIIGGINSALRA